MVSGIGIEEYSKEGKRFFVFHSLRDGVKREYEFTYEQVHIPMEEVMAPPHLEEMQRYERCEPHYRIALHLYLKEAEYFEGKKHPEWSESRICQEIEEQLMDGEINRSFVYCYKKFFIDNQNSPLKRIPEKVA